MYYSASKGGFYDPAIHGDKMPADSVVIANEQYESLLSSQAAGKIIVPGTDGRPLIAEPKPSRADEIRARLAQIDTESIRAMRATVRHTARGKHAPVADVDKLEALETEAAALRAELATLSNGS